MATMYQPMDTPKTSHKKTFCLVLSFAAILSATILLTTMRLGKSTLPNPVLSSICENALHDQASCLAIVSEVASSSSTKTNHVNLLQDLLRKSVSHIENTIQNTKDISLKINDPRRKVALDDCLELLELSKDITMETVLALKNVRAKLSSFTEAHTWLSTVLTNHITCLDGLSGQAKSSIEPKLNDLVLRARTSLAMLVSIKPTSEETMILPLKGDFPSWVTPKDRKLLWASAKDIKANVVVAQDGSGNYKSVKEAVAAAPDKSKTRYVIYVKKGTYKENLEVGKKKKNIMLVGDGMNSTIITGSLNVVDGSSTFRSATLAAVGTGFIAQDIWFQNTAGPQKHQAVALRVGADQSVINRCQIEAYQDTLYAHSNRQFYTDSYITGTVDFIFGNAAVVFQNCKLVARKPMKGQSNMVTAQGRVDPNQNTATSIQKCNIIASPDLEPVRSSVQSFLGRPWKEYSRTVVMQSYIGDHIEPSGWSVWDKDFALKTLYYGEYLNNGPGSSTTKRVDWAGYHVITNAAVAKKFTVTELIQGEIWLTEAGVTFTEGL